MTKKIGNILFLYDEKPHICEVCGKEVETRPYGVDGSEICFECATGTPKRKAEAERQFSKVLRG